MNNIYLIFSFIVINISCSFCGHQNVYTNKYDVCVYGETPAGITAAIQAARMGKKVVLLSTSSHVGGVMTSGLTATDMNNYHVVGGIGREIFQRVYINYLNPQKWKYQDREEFFELSKKRTYSGKNDSLKMQWVYESHVLESILKDMLKEAEVNVVYQQSIDLKNGAIKEGNILKGLITDKGIKYSSSVFIDATYEGDLMAKAGVSYTVGRESNDKYGETLNGILLSNQLPIDPYVEKGDPSSGLLPYIEPKKQRIKGESDNKVQAYCYRITLTDEDSNQQKIGRPSNYNPLYYEFIIRKIGEEKSLALKDIITITPMPNKKTDTNHLDFVGASYDWAEADYETREKIADDHKNYAIGLLWFLGNDPRIPKSIQEEMNKWGFAKDEFVKNNNFPYQLYVREARRMVSDFVMTEHNCNRYNKTEAPKSIGFGCYSFDCHYVARVVDVDDKVKIEGSIYKPVSVYPISYMSIVPKQKECANLLVPVCLSASHVAFSSIRMEPAFMVLGQAAGTAAALCIDNQLDVQELPYELLKNQLLEDSQIIEYVY